jgi:hypothetical protein
LLNKRDEGWVARKVLFWDFWPQAVAFQVIEEGGQALRLRFPNEVVAIWLHEGEDVVEKDAKGPDVGLESELPATDLLWRAVGCCEPLALLAAVLHSLTKPKVTNLRHQILRKENVMRFQVKVSDILVMQVLQTQAYPMHDFESLD